MRGLTFTIVYNFDVVTLMSYVMWCFHYFVQCNCVTSYRDLWGKDWPKNVQKNKFFLLLLHALKGKFSSRSFPSTAAQVSKCRYLPGAAEEPASYSKTLQQGECSLPQAFKTMLKVESSWDKTHCTSPLFHHQSKQTDRHFNRLFLLRSRCSVWYVFQGWDVFEPLSLPQITMSTISK